MRFGIIRPTGVFTAFEEYLKLGARGAVPEIGDGKARTNPIHAADVAKACVEAVDTEGNLERDVGGPDPLSRHQIIELAFGALGKPVKVRRMPVAIAKFASAMARPLHPRLGEIGQFLTAVSAADAIAPIAGSRKLADYFRERAPAYLKS
jgi:uncharacterized protein YbjT (DUF2867 family)